MTNKELASIPAPKSQYGTWSLMQQGETSYTNSFDTQDYV